MALAISTNTGALMAAASASSVNKDMETSMERLSTGKRINSAKDDAAGSAIASRLSSEIRGTNQAIRNAQDGQALINTAEGAHKEVENILQRMRELSVQAANDTNDSTDRANLQAEMDQLLTEVDRIASSTSWAGQALLNGATADDGMATSFADKSSFTFQVGSTVSSANAITVDVSAISAAALGIGEGSSAPSVSNVSVRAAESQRAAQLEISGGTITISGNLENGDAFNLEIDGAQVSGSFSTSDAYTDDLDGFANQIADAILTKQASGGISSDLTVSVGNDGTVSLSRSSAPVMDNVVESDSSGGSSTADISISGNTIAITGTADLASGSFSMEIQGETVTVDFADASGSYTADLAGMGAFLKDTIDGTAEIQGLTVVDNGDGTLTLSQETEPTVISALTNAITADATLAYSGGASSGKLTFGGDFVEGKNYSFDLFGEEYTLTASSDDGFKDTTDGLANQLTQLINSRGQNGITASASGSVVTFTGGPAVSNATVDVDTGTEDAVIEVSGGAANTRITFVDSAGSGGKIDEGDTYSFDINGSTIEVRIASDGYDDTSGGFAAQFEAAINAAGIEGVLVSGDASTMSVNLTYDFAGSGSEASAIETAISSLRVEPTATASMTIENGLGQIDGTVRAGQTFSVEIDGQTVSIVSGDDNYETTKEGVASQLVDAINDAGIAGVVASEEGDGAFSIGASSVAITSAEGALSAVNKIDEALALINTQRANLGALSNRLDNTVSNLTNVSINLEGGKGRIEDADFAAESTALARSQILQQASTAMLAQANASKQNVLSLLQG